MGQLFNRNKMDNLRDLMLSEIDHFVTATKQRSSCVVDATAACRSFEADVICKSSNKSCLGQRWKTDASTPSTIQFRNCHRSGVILVERPVLGHGKVQ